MLGTEPHRIRSIIHRNLARLGYPSVREIQGASYLTPQLVLLRGLSYQRIYSELNALVNAGHATRVFAETGYQLRFCPDPCRFTYYQPTLRPIVQETTCPDCGSRSIHYHQRVYRISGQSDCANCNPDSGELSIIRDPIYGLKFILRDLALLGVADWFMVRLPGTIRGYGSEYKRVCDLLGTDSVKAKPLAVVGHLFLE